MISRDSGSGNNRNAPLLPDNPQNPTVRFHSPFEIIVAFNRLSVICLPPENKNVKNYFSAFFKYKISYSQ